ncbi:MAG: diguanylate cyclase [Burkholderiaceae bacterium]|nr:diguanylate cyclase [Burkholderiales bacterium]MCZ8099197.1 diguanylate cyclase [Burkholderiales bacterium]MCZ8340819.1 diguanylate cyclase [Burkholderiaceae bacterium]
MKAVAHAPQGPAGAARRDASPSATEAARAAIRYLAERKLVPTPGNYRRAWAEVGGPASDVDAEQVAQAAVRLLTQRAEPGEPGFAGLSSSVREQRWSEALSTLLHITKQSPRGRWGTLVASVVEAAMGSGRDWPPPRRLDAIVAAAHENVSNDSALRAQLELLLVQWRMDPAVPRSAPHAPASVEPRPADDEAQAPAGSHDGATAAAIDAASDAAVAQRDLAKLRKVNAELTEIVMSLCNSFETVADEGSWIVSQVDAVRDAVRDGSDRRSLAAARQLLQHALVTQQSIVRSRRDAVVALRDLLPHLVQQMTHLGEHASGFGETLNEHLDAISNADSLEHIAERVRGLIADTRAVHQTFDDARRDLGERSERAATLESEVERLERELAQASERLLTDHLTRTANRAGLERAFDRALQQLRGTGDPLAIALLDIDDFKKVNDALGHQAGDGALRHLAGLLQGKVRAGDTVARYGGEEFVILLPGMTDVQSREMLVRVQRELTREVYLYESKQIFITFSAGTTRVDPQDSIESAIGRADDAMYQAKNAGKNCVAIA